MKADQELIAPFNLTDKLCSCLPGSQLVFDLPGVKPPSMVPSVDEESIQAEFNLKQIDAPMPEAPWAAA